MKLLTIILGSFLVATSIQAEVSSYVAFDRETRAIIEAGDVAQGKLKAASMKCNKCHAENGQGDDDVSVAGHPATYIYKQLKDFKDKKRDGTMVKKVKKLTNQDMAYFSAWYGSLPFAKGAEGGGQLAIDWFIRVTQNVCLNLALLATGKMAKVESMILRQSQGKIKTPLLK